jgi:serine/threonine protein kinase
MRNNFYEGALLDGRYKTVCPLNHGSFGMVFKAQDITTGELVALKCLTKSSAVASGAPAFAVDERSEELVIHSIVGNHPNIVNLLHNFETEHHIYLVLEFCPNGDLYEAIRAGRGPGQTEHVRDNLLQLIDAVEFMHSKGVYHRDIKPENTFLSHSGDMKLGDFGLATMDQISFEAAVGSDRYMAPEQMEPSDIGYAPAKADIWAVGICLLNILFSRNPFATPTMSDPLFSDFATDRQTLFDVFPNMSQDTFDVLVHCLALDPENRSLSAAREAVVKAVSFTTDDESLDDFCPVTAPVVTPSANREPLRTPSISSPQVDQTGAFPWAKALAMTSPHRQLSVIHDTELSDELFPEDNQHAKGWEVKPVNPDNASLVSFVDSGLGLSFNSNNLSIDPIKFNRSKPVPISGSLPATMAKPFSSMAAIFGKKREFESKSWSDLWDEDEEIEKAAHSDVEDDNMFFRDNSLRGLSNASNGSDTPRAGLSEMKNPAIVNNSRDRTPEKRSVDTRVSEHTGFLFEEDHQDTGAVKDPLSPSPQKYSPPSKRSLVDKWAALGDRRRGQQTPSKPEPTATEPLSPPITEKRVQTGGWRKGLGNWSVWGQSSEKTAPSGNESPSPAVYRRKDWNNSKDWRKNEKTLRQVPMEAASGTQFEWVWRM